MEMLGKDRQHANRIKQLLSGATAKNPTCVLGTVLADFTSQGVTELTVRTGKVFLSALSCPVLALFGYITGIVIYGYGR